MRYLIQVYGCQMNTTEGEEMAGICQRLGLTPAENHKDADVVILNSCSVRQAAEDKVYGWGKKVKKKGKQIFGTGEEKKSEYQVELPPTPKTTPKRRSASELKALIQQQKQQADYPTGVEKSNQAPLNHSNDLKSEQHQPLMILTGCMVGSARGGRKRVSETELKRRANFVDYFVDQGEYERQLPYILMREGLVAEENHLETFAPLSAAFTAVRHRGKQAYVKISEGCDNFCTFCVVPYSRGEERHKSKEQILNEVQALVKAGYEEIMLLGQNVNSWGIEGKQQKLAIRINSDQKLPFASLLRAVHDTEGVEKITFITSNPFDFTKDMIEALALPKIDRFLHMAVQSGSNSVLKRMNRRHTIEEFIQLTQDIKKRIPDIRLGTDLIVGFCGETEEEFQDTLKLVEAVEFEVAYTAMYSERPGTLAQKRLDDDVPKEVKKDRYERLVDTIAEVRERSQVA